ncbi:MAG: selenium metabolism-associated LysR family transcriptional regulator [Chloroflexota bacterium]|nr:selenium metabolism-associated LysR family transcriptional regulator [Chloroflexota bacterium]
MNIEYLKTYVEVVKAGSFSEAAKRLGLSQPAVSFQIQKLERDLGVRLIDRGQKAITVTEAGKRVLRFAQSIEEERVHLLQDVERLRHEVTGTMVIAASTIPGEVLLPPLLGEFKTLHPAVGAQVEISDSLTVIDGVVGGAYDVGLCGVAPQGQALDCFKIGEDELVLIVFPGHPFAARGAISLFELDGEPLIFREQTSGTQHSLALLLAEAGLDIERWSPSLVLGTSQAVVTAVEAGVGIAFVSSLAIKKSVSLGLVKQVAVDGLRLMRSFYCIYRQERVVSRLLSEFIAFVRARAAQG